VGRYATVEDWKARVEGQGASTLHLLHSEMKTAAVRHFARLGIWLHPLHLRLHKVEWKGAYSGCKASHSRRGHHAAAFAAESVGFQEALDFRIAGKHAKVIAMALLIVGPAPAAAPAKPSVLAMLTNARPMLP